MQIRESVDLHSVLKTMISSQKPSTLNQENSFERLFDLKKNDSSIGKQKSFRITKETKQVGNTDSSMDTKPLPNEDFKDSIRKVSSENKQEKNLESVTNTKTPKADKKSVKANNAEEVQDNVVAPQNESVMEKIKSILGLNDKQVESLMAFLGVDLAAFEKIVALSSADNETTKLTEIHDLVTQMEIGEALNQAPDLKKIEQLVNTMTQLVQTLEKKLVDNKTDGFDGKLTVQLSKAIDLIRQVSGEFDKDFAVVKESVKKVLGDALHSNQRPLESDSQSLETEEVTFDTKQNGKKAIDELLAPFKNSSNIDVKTNVTQENVVNNFAAKSLNTEVTSEMKVPDTVVLSPETVLKSTGMTTNGPVMEVQNLKRDVFSQIMDAVKGHVKLNDSGTSIAVKLQPEQLGNVELKLNIHKGVVLAEIKVENEMVKAAVESNLDDLKQNLSNKGYSINQINVTIDSGKKEQHAFDETLKNKKNQKSNKDSIETVSADYTDNMFDRYKDPYSNNTINYLG